ncbi:YeiH family protein [Tessaracoccus caeni]|uniref:YeiH family protein n=1 Tax=Tessaracoccus caeni TaxID=3031239 RepID=UPI0023DCC87F|nr:putative sulfate exporter family transporter [Tessaracoccus caeni]MDF1487610.1 putative sulfate exporter family transporter [Tessaracoccus caeni]
MLSLAAAATAYAVNRLLPGMSPLVVAIVLGVLAANVVRLPEATAPGVAFSAKRLLRLGIVFLGLKLALADIVALGAPMLLVIVGIVTIGIFGTLLIGRLLRVPKGLSLLIACGFSICGAAAVAGVAGVVDPDDEAEGDTITAVALVVLFGTLMIPLVPLLAPLLGLPIEAAGMWAGGSIHEVAQVVAAGGLLGGTALSVAVVVKLGRVLLLAPVAAVLSIRQRRAVRAAVEAGQPNAAAKLPPVVPLFVVGFLAMVLLRSFAPLPTAALAVGEMLQTGLLSAAMFALGCGVKLRSLAKVGLKPFILAALATVLVAFVALLGITVVAPV